MCAVFVLSLALCLSGVGSAPAARVQEGGIAHLRIAGPLDAGTKSSLRRALLAARANAGTNRPQLLIELDTPGGEIELMWTLAGQIDAAVQEGVDVSCWVHDRAFSAGVLL